MTIREAEKKQDEFDGMLGGLTTHSAKKKEYMEAKNKLLNNAKYFYKGREKIIEGFKNGIFPLNYNEEEGQTRYEEEENNIRNKNGLIDYKGLERLIDLKNKGTNDKLVRKYFQVQDLGALLEKLKKSKSNTKRSYIQVALIKNGLTDLKEEIKDMSEQEKETENPNEIKDFEKILEFNRQQQAQGLKITTPNQMLSRLPISLAQLKAGNNSEKFKNEIRQLLYSLYRSKKLTKQLYKSLVDII